MLLLGKGLKYYRRNLAVGLLLVTAVSALLLAGHELLHRYDPNICRANREWIEQLARDWHGVWTSRSR